ncbi:MAG TPA: hypothetical protein VFZ59_06980 [Verrucomicrobiae bacterium]|nr:hypothetical protein [Verrucomicrobiae bacterium]
MKELSTYLDAHRAEIERGLREAMRSFVTQADYSVVWKEYERQVIREFIAVINALQMAIKINFVEGEEGNDKNRIADLLVQSHDERILISIKACRGNKNSANDLGAIRQYPEKKAKYSACYDIWVRYDDSKKLIQVQGIYFDRSYKFVGRMSIAYGSGVSYRKKDGNMRPKPWDMFDNCTCFWNTLEEFEVGIARSRSFRANSIVCEHLEDMTEADALALFHRLKKRFGTA